MLGQYRLEGIFRDHLAKHGVQVERLRGRHLYCTIALRRARQLNK